MKRLSSHLQVEQLEEINATGSLKSALADLMQASQGALQKLTAKQPVVQQQPQKKMEIESISSKKEQKQVSKEEKKVESQTKQEPKKDVQITPIIKPSEPLTDPVVPSFEKQASTAKPVVPSAPPVSSPQPETVTTPISSSIPTSASSSQTPPPIAPIAPAEAPEPATQKAPQSPVVTVEQTQSAVIAVTQATLAEPVQISAVPQDLLLDEQSLLQVSEAVGQAMLVLPSWKAELAVHSADLAKIATNLDVTKDTAALSMIRAKRDVIDRTITDIGLFEDTASSLAESGIGGIDENGRPLAEDTRFGESLSLTQQNGLLLLADLPLLERQVDTLLAAQSVKESLDFGGAQRLFNGVKTLDGSLGALGGSATLQSYVSGRIGEADVAYAGEDVRVNYARLQAGGEARLSALNSQLTFNNTGTLTGREYAKHSVAGGITFETIGPSIYDSYGRDRTPGQRLIKTGEGGLRGDLNNGQGSLTATFDKAAYIHAINVTVSGTGQSSKLVVWIADGTSMERTINQSGTVPIGGMVRYFEIQAGNGEGVTLNSIDARATAPALGVDTLDMDAIVIKNGTGVLDLSNSETLVSVVTGSIKGLLSTEKVTATAYRGSAKVSEVIAAADGSFSLQNTQGITSVIFSGGSGTLILSDVATTGIWNEERPEAEEVNKANNATLALSTASQIKLGNWNSVEGKQSMRVGSPGTGPLQGRIQSEAGWLVNVPDYNRYTLITFEGPAPVINGVSYTNDHLKPSGYPKDAYAIYGNTVLLYPTGRADMQMALWVSASGITGFGSTSADTGAELIPPLEATPKFDIVGRTGIGAGTGMWGGPITEWAEGNQQSDSFMGHFNLRNAGRSPLSIASISVHVGETGTAIDPVTYTLNEAKSLGAGAVASVHVPVAMQSNAAGQKWSISATLGDGSVIMLYQGAGFIPPRVHGTPSSRRLYNLAEDGKRAAEQMGISTTVYDKVLAEYAADKHVSQETAHAFTSVPDIAAQFAREVVLDTLGANLHAELVRQFRADGADPVLAEQKAAYKMDIIAANPRLYAVLYGAPTYDGSVEGFKKILELGVAKEKTTTEKILAKKGSPVEQDPVITSSILVAMGTTDMDQPMTLQAYKQFLLQDYRMNEKLGLSTVYQVIKGDSLSKIASFYGLTIDAIRNHPANAFLKDAAHGGDGRLIAIGEKITIPYAPKPVTAAMPAFVPQGYTVGNLGNLPAVSNSEAAAIAQMMQQTDPEAMQLLGVTSLQLQQLLQTGSLQQLQIDPKTGEGSLLPSVRDSISAVMDTDPLTRFLGLVHGAMKATIDDANADLARDQKILAESTNPAARIGAAFDAVAQANMVVTLNTLRFLTPETSEQVMIDIALYFLTAGIGKGISAATRGRGLIAVLRDVVKHADDVPEATKALQAFESVIESSAKQIDEMIAGARRAVNASTEFVEAQLRGAHIIDRHLLNRTDAQLLIDFNKFKHMGESDFIDFPTAARATQEALNDGANILKIQNFLKIAPIGLGKDSQTEIFLRVSYDVGRAIEQGVAKPQTTKGIWVVIEKLSESTYGIITAYPKL